MEEKENKKSIIIFIVILALLLALFIGIRAFSDKKEENKNKDQSTPDAKTEEVIKEKEEKEEEDVVSTRKETKTVVKKTTNKVEEEKDVLSLVLTGEEVVYVDYADTYVDKGAYALDTKEGDLSLSIVKTIYLNGQVVDTIDTTNGGATYTIKYTVTNSRGEEKVVTRTVIIKQALVTLTLNGASESTLEYKSDTYEEAFATAKTDTNEDLTSTITKTITYNGNPYTGEITSDQLGEYIITYSVEYQGKTYQVKRYVYVKDTIAPVITSLKEEYKYLVENVEGASISKEELLSLFSVTDLDQNLTVTLTDTENNEVLSIDKTVEGEYTLVLTVKDSSNNENSKAIVVKVMNDTLAPTYTSNMEEVTNEEDGSVKYVFTILNLDDNYSETSSIKTYYSFDQTTWNEFTDSFELNKSVDPACVEKQVYIKAVDENGNENILSTPYIVYVD